MAGAIRRIRTKHKFLGVSFTGDVTSLQGTIMEWALDSDYDFDRICQKS
jgi:hypothetical protein